MKINVNENNTKYILTDGTEHRINLGYADIHDHGFQAVDHIVDKIYREIVGKEVVDNEEVVVFGDNIESKMIARKLEDRLKREVSINPVSPENNIL